MLNNLYFNSTEELSTFISNNFNDLYDFIYL